MPSEKGPNEKNAFWRAVKGLARAAAFAGSLLAREPTLPSGTIDVEVNATDKGFTVTIHATSSSRESPTTPEGTATGGQPITRDDPAQAEAAQVEAKP